jgi:hypothetical protein
LNAGEVEVPEAVLQEILLQGEVEPVEPMLINNLL